MLLEDDAAVRALQLFRYRQYALKEGLDLPPQQAAAHALRVDLRRAAAPRTATLLPPAQTGDEAEAAAAQGSSVFPVSLGPFQAPFVEFDLAFDAADLPLLLKIRGVALPCPLGAAAHAVFVSGFSPGMGAAERSGRVKPFDQLVKVNGGSVEGGTLEAAAGAIASADHAQQGGVLTLTFRRSLFLRPPAAPGDPGAPPLKTPAEAAFAEQLKAAKAAGADKASPHHEKQCLNIGET